MHVCYKKSFVKRYIATYQPEVLLWHHIPPPSLPRQDLSLFDMVGYGSQDGECFYPDFILLSEEYSLVDVNLL